MSNGVITETQIIEHCRKNNLQVPSNVRASPSPVTILPAPAKRIDIGSGETLEWSIKLAIRAESEANAGGKFRAKLSRKKFVKQAVFRALGGHAAGLPA